MAWSDAAAPPYVMANPGRYGYYRVNYTAPLWQALATAAEDPSLVPAVDLAGRWSARHARVLYYTAVGLGLKAFSGGFGFGVCCWASRVSWAFVLTVQQLSAMA